MEVSIVRHHVKPRSPSQTVSESLRPRLRREPDHALRGMPRQSAPPLRPKRDIDLIRQRLAEIERLRMEREN